MRLLFVEDLAVLSFADLPDHSGVRLKCKHPMNRWSAGSNTISDKAAGCAPVGR